MNFIVQNIDKSKCSGKVGKFQVITRQRPFFCSFFFKSLLRHCQTGVKNDNALRYSNSPRIFHFVVNAPLQDANSPRGLGNHWTRQTVRPANYANCIYAMHMVCLTKHLSYSKKIVLKKNAKFTSKILLRIQEIVCYSLQKVTLGKTVK